MYGVDMFLFRDVIDFTFGTALFFNALLFIPQAICIVRNKTARNVSLITFCGFLIVELILMLYALMAHDYLAMSGYMLNVMTCSSVVILAILYRGKQSDKMDFSTEEVTVQLQECVYGKNRDDVFQDDHRDSFVKEEFLVNASSNPKTTVPDAADTEGLMACDLSYLEKNTAVTDNTPHVLLVEDNPLIQYVTQSLLRDTGFIVDVAGTGAEALKKFTTNEYDLVYMDIGLPDQDGYFVTQAMRARERALGVLPVPVIALTAHGAMDVEAFCMRSGMQGVLSKPLTQEQAHAIWAKFGCGEAREIIGLTIVQQPETVPLEKQIIDLDETVALLGSQEYARELLALWHEMLTHRFLPALEDFIAKRDDEALRQELHTMLGSLCYVKTPLLNQAVLELQTAARNHPNNIEAAYQHVLKESQRFIEYYQQDFV